MGQYYYGVILDAKTNEPIMADYCGKLLESNKADLASFAYELSKGRKGYRQRVVWAGDYSEKKDSEGNTLYRRISDREERGEDYPSTTQDLDDMMESRTGLTDEEYEAVSERNSKRREEYYLAHILNPDNTLKQEIRYLCNHDRREYMDLNDFDYPGYRDYGCNNPLAVLTSDPTCRIKGGGDYFYMDDFQYYSLWSGDVLSTEPEAPEGYKNIGVKFACKTRIWEPDTISELIHGEKYGYRLPAPSAYTFGRMVCRYDDEHIKLACASRETILQMYAEWWKRVDCERVYKAHDVLKRAMKSDPRLEQEHKGVKVEVRHWKSYQGEDMSDTYAVVDGVDFKLYGPYEDGWELYMHHQAKLDGIEYDCDAKSRRHFRQLAKERQASAA